jgi:hypothetical protein
VSTRLRWILGFVFTANCAGVVRAQIAPAGAAAGSDPPLAPNAQRWVAMDGVATPWIFDLATTRNAVTGSVRQRAVNGGPYSQPFELHDGVVSGDTISFRLLFNDSDRVIAFRGVRRGDRIDFSRTVTVVRGGPGGNGVVGAYGATSFPARLLAPGAPVPSAPQLIRAATLPLDSSGAHVGYKGFTVFLGTVESVPAAERDFVLNAVRQQLDMVDELALAPDVLRVLRGVPLFIVPGSGTAAYSRGRIAVPTRSTAPLDRAHPIVLHELCHAYHDLQLADGVGNATILGLYEQARTGGKFPADSYMLSNPREYFAMMTSVYLYGSAARDPFARDSIRVKQPDMYAWLVKTFGRR